MKEIDTSTWDYFTIKDIFVVSRPVARKQTDYDEGNTPFVASGCFNNGIQAFLKPHDVQDIDKGCCITISPVDGYAFFQEDDFLGRGGAGSSIIILRNESLNRYNGQFIASIIRHTFSGWSYANMGNKDIVKESQIKLPVDDDGMIDWLYMENYMKNLEPYVIEKLNILKTIC